MYYVDEYIHKRHPIEEFGSNIGERLNLLKRHIDTSIILYENEKKQKLDSLELKKKQDKLKSDGKYQKSLQEGREPNEAYYLSGELEIDDYYGETQKELVHHYDVLSDILFESLLLTIYGLLEFELKRFCELCQKEWDYRITPDHLGGRDYIESAKNYLELVVDISLKTSYEINLEAYFTKFKNYQFIRNRIAHNGGKVNLQKPSEIKATNPNISISEVTGKIKILKAEFLTDFIDIVGKFFKDLILLVEQKMEFKNLISRLELFLKISSFRCNLISWKKPIITKKQIKVKATGHGFDGDNTCEIALKIQCVSKENIEYLNQTGKVLFPHEVSTPGDFDFHIETYSFMLYEMLCPLLDQRASKLNVELMIS